MKFSQINLKRKGSEDIFLKLLKEKISPSFKEESRDRSRNGPGKELVLKSVKFKAVDGRKILEMTLFLNKMQINHLWLSREGISSFYHLPYEGVRTKVDLERMDVLAPILKKFIDLGIVDCGIFDKSISSGGDDWPAVSLKKKSKLVAEAA